MPRSVPGLNEEHRYFPEWARLPFRHRERDR